MMQTCKVIVKMLRGQHLRRKKVVLALLLLATPVVLLLYSYDAENTKLVRAFREGFKSACHPSRNSILLALIEDGFQPIALSKNMTSSALSMEEQIGRTPTNPFTFTKFTSSQDSNRTRVAQTHENCTQSVNRRIESDQVLVENVVHYVFIGSDLQFKFITYLSFLSVERFLKPDQIFVHGDVIPTGSWWDATVEQVKNIYHIQRPQPTASPNGQPFKFMAHVSDYMRAAILLRYGGIYLDPDVLVLKSFRPLRQFPFVLGRESGDSVGNGIIVSRKNAPFLRLMLEQYWSYQGPNEEWARQSVHNVHSLAAVFPHLVHVEETSLNRPNWMERSQFYEGNYNWTTNYAIHLWLRLWPKEKLPSGLDDAKGNTTFGEIARHILFGSS